MSNKAKERTELATTEVAGALEKPSYIGNTRRGTELQETSDLIMPRLALCQSMTPQRKKSDPAYLEGLEEGALFNSLTGVIYGQQVRIVPLFFYKSRIMFKPMDEGGGVLCQAPDGKSCQLNNGGPCLHDSWGPNGEKPQCTELFNFPSLLYPSRELIVLSFKATAIKAGKQLNSLIRFRNADAFAGVYAISTAPDKNAAGQEYYTYVVKNAGWVDEEFFKFAEQMYEALAPKVSTGALGVDVATLGPDDDVSFNTNEM
jgi:hypothetical protein